MRHAPTCDSTWLRFIYGDATPRLSLPPRIVGHYRFPRQIHNRTRAEGLRCFDQTNAYTTGRAKVFVDRRNWLLATIRREYTGVDFL